jgi:hypothetical protein
MLEDFYHTGKIQRLQLGLNPRTRVPEASMLTTRPPKPVKVKLMDVVFLTPVMLRPGSLSWPPTNGASVSHSDTPQSVGHL